jgi:hypothetical protein
VYIALPGHSPVLGVYYMSCWLLPCVLERCDGCLSHRVHVARCGMLQPPVQSQYDRLRGEECSTADTWLCLVTSSTLRSLCGQAAVLGKV